MFNEQQPGLSSPAVAIGTSLLSLSSYCGYPRLLFPAITTLFISQSCWSSVSQWRYRLFNVQQPELRSPAVAINTSLSFLGSHCGFTCTFSPIMVIFQSWFSDLQWLFHWLNVHQPGVYPFAVANVSLILGLLFWTHFTSHPSF